MRPRLVLATTNADKLAELVDLLGERYEVVSRPSELPETVEDQLTLIGNATKKAVEIATATATVALADDTGLFVDALDGRPGVHTARYAGDGATYEQNVTKLLGELASVVKGRGAQFRTCVALAWPDGRVLLGEGMVEGTITETRRGSGGFGYDPVFAPVEGDGRTFAEMARYEKAALSHRSRALSNLLRLL
jgi:XTP/dITP diphosphohydrolase